MAHFQSMVSMARGPDDIKKELPAPTGTELGPVYPYGLALSLTDKELDKLDMDELPEVGDTIHLCCFAKVTSVSQHEETSTDGQMSKRRRVELQITDIAGEDEDEENRMTSEERAERRYG